MIDATIVIPAFNAEAFIQRSVQSAVEQGAQVVVVDDGSIDGTMDRLREFRSAVEVITGPNEGAAAARNKGLARAKTEFVSFLDADDWVEGPFLSGRVTRARETGADIVFGHWVRVGVEGTRRPGSMKVASEDMEETLCARLAGPHWMQLNAVLWRTAYLRSIGGWNSERTFADASDLILRGIARGGRLAVCNQPAGRSIFFEHQGKGRLTQRPRAKRLPHQHAILLELPDHLGPRMTPRIQDALAAAWYRLACRCHELGDHRLGEDSLKHARMMGLQGHPGGGMHAIAAHILGLRAKIWAAKIFRSLRSKNSV